MRLLYLTCITHAQTSVLLRPLDTSLLTATRSYHADTHFFRRPTPALSSSTRHGASRLVQAMPVWSVKTRRAPYRQCRKTKVSTVIRPRLCLKGADPSRLVRPGIVRMRGFVVSRLRPCMKQVHPSPPRPPESWYSLPLLPGRRALPTRPAKPRADHRRAHPGQN